MELAVHPNELLVLYDSSSQLSKKTLAFARTVSDHIQEIEFKKTQFRNTIWKEILDLLQLPPKELLNKAHPEYKKMIRGNEFRDDDWLNVISHNPELIRGPIAIKNKKAVLCLRPKDILKVENQPKAEVTNEAPRGS